MPKMLPPPQVRVPPPSSLPPPPIEGGQELQKAWIESMKNGLEHSDAMFGNILSKFTKPF